MSDLTVVALLEARAEGIDEVRAALVELVTATLAEEGCVDYKLSESITSPGTFVFVETWRSAADLDAHSKSEHVQAAFGKVGSLLASQPAVHPLNPIV